MPPKSDKKASTSAEASYDYKPDEIIVNPDDDMVNDSVRKERRGKESYLVQFFPTGDYGWLTARDLSLLTPREIDIVLENPKKLKKEIIEGYKVAQDPTEWKRERADKHAEWVELQEQMAAEEDQLEDDDAPEPAAKADGKKRKRPSAAAKDGDKKKKTPAKAPKSKGDDDAAPAPKKAKTTANSDDPAEIVKSWRHKLQKVFLGKTDPPASEMAACGEYFDQMETFEMKEEWLRESKLNKVLKRIALMKDNSIPEEEKYSFRQRSGALANKWTSLVGGAEASPAPAKAEQSEATATEANGVDSEPKRQESDAQEPAASAEDEAKGDDTPAVEAPEKKEDDVEMKADEPAPQTNGDAAATEEEPKPAEAQPSATDSAPAASTDAEAAPAASA
ncbi:hypothetical protein BMF94_2985 [Rhodotorula taiwanensis]|uniref:PWWP domain-containing protein n=1 Tax=Rhodotorula taiwanensis TaxID=741276 RepID=A0A2S5BB09_9BASI|nr:hypothetical protein BMF94_2985 [Rhodotorula taiwanensis]